MAEVAPFSLLAFRILPLGTEEYEYFSIAAGRVRFVWPRHLQIIMTG